MKLSEKLFASGVPQPRRNSNAGAALARAGVERSSEFNRIDALPRRSFERRWGDMVLKWTQRFRKDEWLCGEGEKCPICCNGATLLRIQAAMLEDAEQAWGLFAAVGVGHGKTLTSLLLPAVLKSERCVLLVPPNLREKTRLDQVSLGKHFRLPDCIHVVAYSELSSVSSADVLERLQPDLIVADEAHNLRHKDAARTKRFLRYMKEHPDTRFCALSGTMTNRSIMDYAHLIELALRKNSPLPNNYSDLMNWSEALDVSGKSIFPMAPGVLLEWATEQEQRTLPQQEAARAGFRRRLVESLGVVATEEGSIGTSLVIQARSPQAYQMVEKDPSRYLQTDLPKVVQEHLERLRSTWEIGGEELTDPMSLARIARQLALGFYYVWDWPGGVKDMDWLEARALWHRTVRHILRYKAREGLDSPLLVARAAARDELAADEQEAWETWCLVKEQAEPPVKPVWLDEFAAKDAAKWAEEPGIVWCEHRAFGQRVAALLCRPYYGGGTDSELLAERGDKPVICSIRAHSEGKNLQYWSRNLLTCPPSAGKVVEQVLGRTHRRGQEADEVQVEVFLHTDELRSAWDSALESARYIEQTQGIFQKVLYAERIGC